MPCNDRPTNCAPCGDCPPPAPPILPRCDIALNDGVYPHATVVIENGCIIDVQPGVPFLYQPSACCGGGGGAGGGGDGLDGNEGPPGQNATITIGSVTTLAPGSPATVVNVGTETNAVLNFGLPAGAPGAAAPNITGVTLNDAGWRFESGLVKDLPFQWPPIVQITSTSDYAVVNIQPVKDDDDGSVELRLLGMDAFRLLLETTMDAKDADVNNQLMLLIQDLQTQITTLKQCLEDNCGCSDCNV